MRLYKNSITAMASEHRTSLRVWDYPLWPGQDIDVAEEVDMVDVPDDWVHLLHYLTPVIGKEKGFLYLTRKGYEANKDALRTAFESADQRLMLLRASSWQEFEHDAEEHFAQVERNALRRLQKMTRDYRAMREACKALSINLDETKEVIDENV